MIINNSPDISSLLVQVTFDISGALPVINLVNLSSGSNLANVSYAFVVNSPSNTPIHQGDINTPDVTGVWSNFALNDSWPRPFNQIEWSGAPYQFTVIAKDSIGNIYTNPVQLASICRPNGNTQFSKNTYGLSSSTVNVKCQQGRVFFQDTTYTSYKGVVGTQVSSVLRVIYPIDETASIPPPFVTGSYNTALVPISYSSSNYQFLQNSVYSYDLGNNVLINVKYQLLQTFAVWCNVDLLPLKCEIDKLINQVETGNCSDVVASQRILNIVIAKFCLVIMGIEQPLIGVDVAKLVNEIIEIGCFECNCCGAPTGIIPVTASIIDGYSFSVNKLGGDVNGNFTTNGSNIVLNIGDTSYVVAIGQSSPSYVNAFSFQPSYSGDGFVKTYFLNIDGAQLSIDTLANIPTNATALNLFRELVLETVGSSNFQLIVDGGCIFSSTASCDYDFTVSNIPVNTTFALLTSIRIGNISRPISFAFNQTNLASLQSYLFSLDLGDVVVQNLGSGNVIISFDNNTNELIALTYMISGTSYQADFSRNCTGYVPVSANEVVQNIIDYLCGLTDAEITTSAQYVINYIDANGIVQNQTVNAGTELTTFILALLADNLITINYISSLSKLNCTNIQTNFPQSSQLMQSNDYFLGTKNGSCARIAPTEAFSTMLQLAAFDPTTFNDFCNLVNLCRGGHPCTAFNIFSLAVVDHSPADNEQNIIVTFTNPDPQFVSVEVQYARIDNTSTPVYIFSGIALAGASPYTITNLPEGQYSISLIPFFSDGRQCPPVFMSTPPCTGVNAFNATFDGTDINVTYSVSSPQFKITIVYPNGGTFTQIYNNGDDVAVAAPTGVYGNYTVTIQAVCNETTGFFGTSSAPAIVSIPQPTGIVTATAQSSLTAGFYVANVGGIPLFSLSNNLAAPNTQTGIHTAMVAQPISFSVVNPTAGSSTFNGVDIYVNASFITRVQFNTGTGVYSSSNITANATDTILLDFNNNE